MVNKKRQRKMYKRSGEREKEKREKQKYVLQTSIATTYKCCRICYNAITYIIIIDSGYSYSNNMEFFIYLFNYSPKPQYFPSGVSLIDSITD